MINLFKSLFTTPQRSGRRLHRDAVAIIESDQRKGSTEHLQSVADHTRDELTNIENRLTANPENRSAIVYDLQQKHKNARRRRDYALFTATTLVLIYLRAKALGEPGESAIQAVDNFIDSLPMQNKND